MSATRQQCDELVTELTDKFAGARYQILSTKFFYECILPVKKTSYEYALEAKSVEVMFDLGNMCACSCQLDKQGIYFLINKDAIRTAVKNGHLKRF